MTNTDSDELKVCDTCGEKRVTTVIASGLAPVSVSQCLECQNRGAEVLGVVHMWIGLNGGIEKCPDFSSSIISVHEGNYIGWEEISALYTKRESQIAAEIKDNFPTYKSS